MKSRWYSATNGPCRRMWVLRQALLSLSEAGGEPEDDRPEPPDENEPLEYTLLMLMPPRKATLPSTTSSLRWSRWLISQPLRAEAGLTGLNSSTLMPASVRRLKKASGVRR